MTSGVLCAGLGSTVQERHGYIEASPVEATSLSMGLEHVLYKTRLRAGFSRPGEEKTSKSYCCVQLPRKDGARLFLEVYSEMTRGSRQIGTQEVLITYKDCFFFFLLTVSMTKYDDSLTKRWWNLHPWRYSKFDSQGLDQCDLTGSVLSRVELNDLPSNLNYSLLDFNKLTILLLWSTFCKQKLLQTPPLLFQKRQIKDTDLKDRNKVQLKIKN